MAAQQRGANKILGEGVQYNEYAYTGLNTDKSGKK